MGINKAEADYRAWTSMEAGMDWNRVVFFCPLVPICGMHYSRLCQFVYSLYFSWYGILKTLDEVVFPVCPVQRLFLLFKKSFRIKNLCNLFSFT